MDTVNFIKERARMCRSFGDECEKCPAFNACEDELYSCAVDVESPMNAEDQLAIVETWSKENPRKTRQSVFLKQNPEADLDRFELLRICPKFVSADYRINREDCNCVKDDCVDCRRDFWMQEVE